MECNQVVCLFCQSGMEAKLVSYIAFRGYGKAIFPQKKQSQLHKKAHKGETDSAPLMMGYVFFYVEDDIETWWTDLQKREELIRVLHYGDEEEPWLVGQDLSFAQWIWNQNGIIEKVAVMQVGDRIKIVDSAFRDMNGQICKVDRRKQTCQIELDGNSMIKHLWLPYDIIEKIDEKAP